LVPAYIGTLQQMTGNELSTIALALASAERAPFGHRGAAAENALTEAVDEAALIPTANERSLTSGPAGAQQPAANAELATAIQLLPGQMQALTARILAAARFYNVNVERYHRQRMRAISRLFTSVFKPREPFTELAGDEGGPTSARGQELTGSASTSATAARTSTAGPNSRACAPPRTPSTPGFDASPAPRWPPSSPAAPTPACTPGGWSSTST